MSEEIQIEEKNEVSLLGSLLKFFTAPSKVFPQLIEKKSWVWVPIVVIIFSMFFSVYTFYERVDRESFILHQISKSKFASNMGEDKIDEAVKSFKEKSSLVQSLIAPPFYFIWLLLATLVYYFSFFLLSGSLKFLDSLIVVLWSELVISLAQIISIPVMIFKKGEELINPQEILLSNLGAIIGSEHLSPALFSLLSSIDIFAIWNLVFLSIGFSYVSKLDKKYCAFLIFFLYILKTIIKVVWAYFMMG